MDDLLNEVLIIEEKHPPHEAFEINSSLNFISSIIVIISVISIVILHNKKKVYKAIILYNIIYIVNIIICNIIYLYTGASKSFILSIWITLIVITTIIYILICKIIKHKGEKTIKMKYE